MAYDRDAIDGRDVTRALDPALDRRIDLTAISGAAVAWAGVVAVALLTRLVAWTAWPLAPGEAAIATDALALVRGESMSAEAATRPLSTAAVALSLFLFGPTDGAVRLAPLLAGLGAVVLLYSLGRLIGPRAALAAAALAAISPALSFAARRVDGGAILVFTSLLLLVAVSRWVERPTGGRAALTGIAAALLLLSSPLGWIALPLVLLVAVLATGLPAGRGMELAAAGLAFLTTVLAVTTSLFTRPGGFAAFFGESLSRLWEAHLATLGQQWFLAPFQLATDELLGLTLAVYAVAALARRTDDLETGVMPGARETVAVWAGLAIIAAMLLGGKSPELFAFAALPVTLLAGIGLATLLSRLRWRALRSVEGAGFVLALLLAVLAGISLLGLLLGDPAGDVFLWLLRFLILGLLVFAPLLALTIWLGRRLDAPAAPLAGLLVVLLLTLVGLRTSMLLAYPEFDRGGEILTAGSTSPGVTAMLGRIDRLSRDLTTFTGDVRDPTGGHGLTITVDQSIAQPFRWYLRDYPNLVVLDPDLPVGELAFPEVVISRPEHAELLVPRDAGYVARPFPMTAALAPALAQPDWGDLARAAVSPYGWRRFQTFLIDRQTAVPPEPVLYTLALREDIAARIYGPEPARP